MHYVYILLQSDGKYYAGSSQNLRARMQKHEYGQVTHTSKVRPLRLVWYSVFPDKEQAIKFEKYLKSSSGKAFRNKHLL